MRAVNHNSMQYKAKFLSSILFFPCLLSTILTQIFTLQSRMVLKLIIARAQHKWRTMPMIPIRQQKIENKFNYFKVCQFDEIMFVAQIQGGSTISVWLNVSPVIVQTATEVVSSLEETLSFLDCNNEN